MNHQLWARVGARVIALAFVVAGASACHDRISDVSSGTPTPPAVTGSAQVIGTVPANPTGDPAGTSPVAANTTDITKHEEVNSKPQEGDNHSYSTVAPSTPQKSDRASSADSKERKSQ